MAKNKKGNKQNKQEKESKSTGQRLGKLTPKHRFFLNPYSDARFSTCPQCNRATKLRKNPFMVFIFPKFPIVLNMTGRYCPACDLLILHQDKVEQLLVAACELHGHPEVIGNEYLVGGIVERSFFRETSAGKPPQGLLMDYVHDFKEHVTIKPLHWGWGTADPDTSRDDSNPKGTTGTST